MRIATKLVLATTTMIVATATGLHAQVAEKKTLTLEGARMGMAAAVNEARKLDGPGGAIAIVDDGGHFGPGPMSRGAFAWWADGVRATDPHRSCRSSGPLPLAAAAPNRTSNTGRQRS